MKLNALVNRIHLLLRAGDCCVLLVSTEYCFTQSVVCLQIALLLACSSGFHSFAFIFVGSSGLLSLLER